MIGTTISHYRVTDELGRGGMGVVYKAEDSRLSRTVAVKVLPSHSLVEEEDRSRFGREAQASAALNHPHIATVYEIDEEDGQSFIVMEYVDGPSLKERIAEGPLKLDETVRLAIQVASGLEAAHEQGIVHRDIKPANVMLTKKGEAKIMDFGLAKLSDQTTLTQTGTTLGTVAYMSPEQARGDKVDHRSDIFALGVVIYEIVTGQSAFKGAYAEAIVYSILNVDPEPITALRTGVPMELERIVDKALAKNPKERYQGMSDLLVDLKALSKTSLASGSGSVKTTSLESTQTKNRPSNIFPWAVAMAMIFLAVLALWQPWSGSAERAVVTKTSFQLPDGQSLVGHGSSVAISRDGKRIVYTAMSKGNQQLYLKEIDSFAADSIPATVGGYSPFFSPDGNWIGFFQEGEIKKLSLSGGKPQTIVNVGGGGGAYWSDDDQVVFYAGIGHGIQRISSNGGSPEVLTSQEKHFQKGEHFHFWPQTLPGNHAVLFSSQGVGQTRRVSVIIGETDTRRTLLEDAGYARYVKSGHLIYSKQGELLAVPFDIDNLTISGTSVPVVEGVLTGSPLEFSTAHYAISDNGTLVYVPGSLQGLDRHLISVSTSGDLETLSFAGVFSGIRVSPDGQRIVMERSGDIWIGNLERGDMRRMTGEEGGEYWPIWSRDGSQIFFTSDMYGGTVVNIYRMPADGSAEPERITTTEIHQQPQSFSPDGSVLAITQIAVQSTGHDIFLVDMEKDFETKPFLQTSDDESHPSFSPDGDWIAYSSDESGQREVYMRPYPGPGAVIPISIGGGTEPVWSEDGGRIFYRDISGNRVMVVSVEDGAPPRIARPELVFEGEYGEGAKWGRRYDVWPDGSRFLLVDESGSTDLSTQFNVVYNWFEELESIVSASK